MSLTQGAIEKIYNSSGDGNGAIVQVLDVKRINGNNGGAQRYRLVVSDGIHYQQAMLATQLNDMVANDQVKQHCLVKLSEVICNVVQDRRIIIVLGMTVCGEHAGKIGTPQNIEQAMKNASVMAPSGSSAASTPAPQAANPYMKKEAAPSRPVTQTSSSNFTPINALNPYYNKWTIRAKVMKKGDVRTWSNARGEGKLFSFELADDQGGEIKCTLFRDGADKFFDMIKEGNTYVISRANLKPANAQYNTCKNDYELNGDGNTNIEQAQEDIKVTVNYDFKSIGDLTNVGVGSTIDIIGAVTEVKDVRTVNTKRGDSVSVRDLVICDDSNASVSCSLWGSNCENFDSQIGTIVCMKGVKVGDFNGVSLSAMGSTQIAISPDIPRAHEIKGWYDGGNATNITSLSTGGGGGTRGPKESKTLGQIKEEDMGRGEKPDWFETTAMVSFIKHDATWHYVAAPESKKKCVDNGDGTWSCEAENKTYQNHEVIRRYILSLTLNDHTGVQWFSAFDDVGVKLLGKTADELYQIKEMDGGDAEFEKVFAQANFQEVNVVARAKYETYQDEARLKCTANSLEPVNYTTSASKMLGNIQQMLART